MPAPVRRSSPPTSPRPPAPSARRTVGAAIAATPAARVGLAGWSVLRAHAGLLDDGETMLARYATRFDVAEINSSFYRSHQPKTYARWASEVPAGFRFVVKLPRAISHEQRLVGSGELLDRFVAEAGALGDRLACVLVQLPPSLAYDPRTAGIFFGMLRRRVRCGIACEPRHRSWFDERVDAMWLRHRVARVAADPAICPEAALPAGDPAWRYWRWHGSPQMYYSRYDDAALARLADALAATPGAATRKLVIFDNTARGHAAGDAARLQDLLQERADA
jgi:uncharacterized protein YecE (DUF72 family)